MRLQIKISRAGKSPLSLIKDIRKEMPQIVSDDLEYIRGELYKEAPRMDRSNDNRESHVRPKGRKHLSRYLKQRSRCQRRTSPLSGYIFFDEGLVPHIKFVIEKVKKHRIPVSGSKLMKFWSLKANKWVFAKVVNNSGGSPANNFIERVYDKSYGHIVNGFIKRMRKALRK